VTVTTPTHVDSSIPELWARLVLRDSLRAGFWSKFVGDEGSRSPIIRRTDTLNNPGDTIHIQTTGALTGGGVAGDTTALEGSEENLTTSTFKVIPLLYRHGVRWYRRAAKKSIVDLRGEARMRLAEWGQEKMDDVRFANFVQTATLNGETYTPNTAAVGTESAPAVPGDVASTDTLDVQSLQKVKLDMYTNRALPLKTVDGDEFFAMVCHPNTLYDLKRSDEYRDWVREAEVRGKDNPFFRGAVAMIDGVLLFQHNNVTTAADGAGSIAVSRNILFGAEAFIEGVDENPSWAEDDFDYGNEFGIGYSFAYQPRRALAKNSIVVYAAAVAP
jgi:N4-gp56 family major capsid protein